MTKVGIVGAGAMARVHAAAWRSLGVELTAWSRSGIAGLGAPGAPAPSAAPTLAALLESVDLVDVCSPTASHPAIVRAAFAARVAVVCEKPLALTVAEASALVAEARDTGVALYVGHVLRYFPEYAVVKAALSAGVLGEPAVARFVRMGEFPGWSTWFGDDRLSGGILLDQMIHDLDMAAWLLGPVTSVNAVVSAPVPGSPVRTAHAVLRHESEAISSATGVWGAPGLAFATRFEVAGSAGCLRYDSRSKSALVLDLGDGAEGPPAETGRPTSAADDPYAAELADVLTVLRDGGATRVSGDEAVDAVRIARAAIESAASGGTVSLSREAP